MSAEAKKEVAGRERGAEIYSGLLWLDVGMPATGMRGRAQGRVQVRRWGEGAERVRKVWGQLRLDVHR